MKALFLKTIPNVGKAGDVKDVADGYFRNFLLPRGLAKKATPHGMREAEYIRTRSARQHAEEGAALRTMLEELKDTPLILYRKATDEGHLFGSVIEKDIAEALSEKGRTVGEQYIHLDSPIKELGTHVVSLHYSEDVTGTISIAVERSD